MNNLIRAFIAIPLDPKIQHSIEHVQNHLKKTYNDIKWVTPENAHITLKFLGDIDTKQVKSVKEAIANCTQKAKSFTVNLSRLGAFPNSDHPRTIWVGLNDIKQRLSQIVESLDKELGKIGFQSDQKPFHPHITIGRIRFSKSINVLSQSTSNNEIFENCTQIISKITLFQSTLHKEGPIYKSLYQIKFRY